MIKPSKTPLTSGPEPLQGCMIIVSLALFIVLLVW